MRWFGLLWILVVLPLWADETLPPVDDFRSQALLSRPALDPALSQSACRRAETLFRQGSISHEDSQGRGPGLQMLSEGFPPGYFGEVLGAGPSLEAVWAAWLTSPSHRDVLRERGWVKWGWGRAGDGARTVWVLRFWKP